MEFQYLRFDGGPYNNEIRAVAEPVPKIYPVPIMRTYTRMLTYLDDPTKFPPPTLDHVRYELQAEYDLETGEVCGWFYKLIYAPDWYYQLQVGTAR